MAAALADKFLAVSALAATPAEANQIKLNDKKSDALFFVFMRMYETFRIVSDNPKQLQPKFLRLQIFSSHNSLTTNTTSEAALKSGNRLLFPIVRLAQKARATKISRF